MKRKAFKLFAGMLAMTILLSMTACGSSDETKEALDTTITKDTSPVTEIKTKNETKSAKNETQTETESQDKTDTQAETEPQDKADTQTETEPQDKADTQTETESLDKADTQTETEPQDKADTQAKTVSEKEETADDSEQYETLEDYLNNNAETKNAFDKQFAVSSTNDITISYNVKGNELTCTLKFMNNSMIDANIDDIKSTLDEALEAQADSFKRLVKELDEAIGKEGACTIIIRYTDSTDNVLAEKAFRAD